MRCAVLYAAILLTSASAAKVIGEDDRRAPGPEDAELLSALGLIVCSKVVEERRRRSAGTGTVVGSRGTILTSAHVLIDEAGRRGPQVRFDAASDCVFRQYDLAGDLRVEMTFAHGEMGGFWYNPGLPNHDWAVLRTTRPLPESTLALPFAVNDKDIEDLAGLGIKMLAYHADRRSARRAPMLSEGRLLAIDYGGFPRLAHTADTERMSSGAAIVLGTRDGRHVVVGINRSSANFGEFNLAVPLSIELEAILRGYAYGDVPLREQRLARTGADRGALPASFGL